VAKKLSRTTTTTTMIKFIILFTVFLPVGLSTAYLIFQRGKLMLEEKRLELDAKRDEQTRKMLTNSYE
jgi:hypothetical protein